MKQCDAKMCLYNTRQGCVLKDVNIMSCIYVPRADNDDIKIIVGEWA